VRKWNEPQSRYIVSLLPFDAFMMFCRVFETDELSCVVA
jgi:hypothetical protein